MIYSSSFNPIGGGKTAMIRNRILPVVLLVVVPLTSALAAEEIQVSSVLIKLIEQVEVPARESGVLADVMVREGEMVAAGAPLAQIEDADAQLDKRRAQLELVGARRQAESDVKVRFAKKSLEVAQAELRRAVDSEKRLAQSVSQSELDQLRLVVQKNTLEIEQAQLELDLAKTLHEVKQNDLEIAEHSIQQRRISAALAGFVVQINRRRGEWVQPGQTILRILRLDRLRAEGLVSAQNVRSELNGSSVKLTVQLGDQASAEFTGKIVFVSPEIDPVNGQVRVWAEIDNGGLQLRPGLHGSMVIDSGSHER
jgi:macrolide-specific efflux system membrane fusion protein